MLNRGRRLNPFVPTPQDVVEKIIDLAEIREGHVVLDLGSGDARIPLTAALRTGCIGIGIEINKELVSLANKKLKEYPSCRVSIINEDFRNVDLSTIDIVTAYLTQSALKVIKPALETLKNGAVVISHDYAIPGWRPIEVCEVWSSFDGRIHRLFKYKSGISNLDSHKLVPKTHKELVKLDEVIKSLKAE